MKRKGLIVLTLLMVSLMVFAGAAQEESADKGNMETAEWVYGISDLTLTHPYHRAWFELQQEVAIEFGANVIFKNAEMNIEQQIVDIDALIELGVDVLHIVPLDPVALEASVNKALDAGIKVLISASQMDIPGVVSAPLGGYTNFSRMAEVVAAYLEYEGNVFFVAEETSSNEAKDRLKGFTDTMAKYDGINMIEWGNAEADPVKAANITEDWLNKYDDIDMIGYASNQLAMPGIEILKNHSKENDIFVIGFDGEKVGLDAVEAGYSLVDCMIDASAWTWITTQLGYRLFKDYDLKAVEPFDLPLIMKQETADIAKKNGADFSGFSWITVDQARTFGSSAAEMFGKAATDARYGK